MLDHWWIVQQVVESRIADMHRTINALHASAMLRSRESTDAPIRGKNPAGRESVVARIRAALGRRLIALGTVILCGANERGPCIGSHVAGQRRASLLDTCKSYGVSCSGSAPPSVIT